jgi:hypothetical protein
MNPKEKAAELVYKFIDIENLGRFSNDGFSQFSTSLAKKQAKQCALIAIDEILKVTKNGLGLTIYSKEYWQEVKKEIELYE